MDDLPDLRDVSVNDLERLVEGRQLSRDLVNFLGNCHRAVNVGGYDPDQAGSAGLGYLSLEPIPDEDAERAKEYARERGWLKPDGFVWS